MIKAGDIVCVVDYKSSLNGQRFEVVKIENSEDSESGGLILRIFPNKYGKDFPEGWHSSDYGDRSGLEKYWWVEVKSCKKSLRRLDI